MGHKFCNRNLPKILHKTMACGQKNQPAMKLCQIQFSLVQPVHGNFKKGFQGQGCVSTTWKQMNCNELQWTAAVKSKTSHDAAMVGFLFSFRWFDTVMTSPWRNWPPECNTSSCSSCTQGLQLAWLWSSSSHLWSVWWISKPIFVKSRYKHQSGLILPSYSRKERFWGHRKRCEKL